MDKVGEDEVTWPLKVSDTKILSSPGALENN